MNLVENLGDSLGDDGGGGSSLTSAHSSNVERRETSIKRTPVKENVDEDDGAIELPSNGSDEANGTMTLNGGSGGDGGFQPDHYEGQLVDTITVSELKVREGVSFYS